jgi:hypothetical protein
MKLQVTSLIAAITAIALQLAPAQQADARYHHHHHYYNNGYVGYGYPSGGYGYGGGYGTGYVGAYNHGYGYNHRAVGYNGSHRAWR